MLPKREGTKACEHSNRMEQSVAAHNANNAMVVCIATTWCEQRLVAYFGLLSVAAPPAGGCVVFRAR